MFSLKYERIPWSLRIHRILDQKRIFEIKSKVPCLARILIISGKGDTQTHINVSRTGFLKTPQITFHSWAVLNNITYFPCQLNLHSCKINLLNFIFLFKIVKNKSQSFSILSFGLAIYMNVEMC